MIHTPVLVQAILDLFQPNQSSRLLDATIGTGGHTKAFLTAAGLGATAVGLDADAKALSVARQELAAYGDQITYLHTNFANLKDSLLGGGILQGDDSTLINRPPVGFTHILFDLGIGSHQLADDDRGFSFNGEGPLDMSYGQLRSLPEADLAAINHLTEYVGHYPNVAELIIGLAVKDLADTLRHYGEERFSQRIAQALHQANEPRSAREMADIVAGAVPSKYDGGRLHPATRTFQALRLAVNRELEAVAQALPQAKDCLSKKGIIAVISWHSLEDRLVKRFFRDSDLTVLTKKPIRPKQAEISSNPRSRSAKLRAAVMMA